ncbi:MAG: NADH-quinone oxidoreductase subunit C [Desulfobacterales bacterium]
MNGDLFAGLSLLLDSRPSPKTTGLMRSVFLSPDQLVPAARRLLGAGHHLEDISGLDTVEGILVNYHFDDFERPGRIALRVLVVWEDLCLPSIAAVFGGAEWHEREVRDFFGVAFSGNPNPANLLLPADDTITPLRKAENARRTVRELIDPGTIVAVDPQFDRIFPPLPQGEKTTKSEGPA